MPLPLSYARFLCTIVLILCLRLRVCARLSFFGFSC